MSDLKVLIGIFAAPPWVKVNRLSYLSVISKALLTQLMFRCDGYSAVLRDVAKKRGVDMFVDSCGTAAYHAGEEPDGRTISTCAQHNIPIEHSARQIQTSDFTQFTHILAADDSNLRNLERVKPKNATAEVCLWGSYLDNKPIADPYYGGINGFERVYQQCLSLSNAFLDQVANDRHSQYL